MKRSSSVAANLEKVRAFRTAFELYLECYVWAAGVGGFGSMYMLITGRELDEHERAREVDRTAGPAAPIVGSVYIAGSKTSLLANWRRAFEGMPPFGVDDIVGVCLQREGSLEHDLVEAQREERTLAGRLGYLLNFPARVRRAAGFESRRGQAFAYGFGVAVLVTVVGTVLAGVALAVLNIPG